MESEEVKSVDELLKEIYGELEVRIRGISPLLMNQPPEEIGSAPTKKKEYDKKEEAENAAYRIQEGELKGVLYIPNVAVYGSILTASTAYKAGKKSIRYTLAGTVRVFPEHIPLIDINGEHIRDYEVDVRPVRIQKKDMVMRSRARVDEWWADFTIYYDKTFFTKQLHDGLKNSLIDAGRTVGLLDFRPQHQGWFGTYIVEKYEIKN